MKKSIIATCIAIAASHAYAIDPFTPLTGSATLANTNEATAPFLLPAGWTQTKVVDVNKLNSASQFNGTYPATFRAFDMIDIGGANNELIYIPHEVSAGAGVTRYNRDTDTSAILLKGNNTGVFDTNPNDGWSSTNDDFGALDPAVLTPNNKLLVAEEWAGAGRIFQLDNPETATDVNSANWTWLSSIPSVSHEGLKFDSQGNLYFVDENQSGSIYRFTPKVAGDLSVGQTFVLRDNDGLHSAAQNYNQGSNATLTNRTGAATWIAMTDADGNKLTTADPFAYGAVRGGNVAADELNATPYGRPEDLEIGTLANGNEVLYFTATSEQSVFSIELTNATDSLVRLFVKGGVTVDEFGNIVPGGQQSGYGLGSPDNLAIDADGTVFIIEDQNPGDIWAATDANGDGVAEKMALFASLGPFGSEPSGFMVDPRGGFLVTVQHPSSNNDAVWSIQQAPQVPVPAAAWLMGSGLVGLAGLARRKQR